MNYLRLGCLWWVGFTAIHCTLHRVRDAETAPDFTPASFSDSGEVQAPDRWWEAFDDSELNRLIETSLHGNVDLHAAWARLKQFEAIAVQAWATLLPEVTAAGSASRSRSIFAGQSATNNFFTLGLDASYEVDLWKRLRSLEKAGVLDWRASREDLETIALALTAAVAQTWYGMVEQRQQDALLAEQVEVNRKLLEVIEIRFRNGGATAVDVYQQREQLAAVRAQIPPVRATLGVLEHQLAVLLGRAPTEPLPGERARLPGLPSLPETGLPADLLNQRPDLKRAVTQIAAADQRVGAAIAARYPALRLTGDTGFQAEKLGDLFSNWIWSLVAGIAGPVFDSGRRKAEVTRSRAVLAERISFYEKTYLEALREVEDALVLERYQHELLEKLQNQLDLAQAAYDAGQARYLRGVGDFLVVLTEIQAVQRIQRSLLTAQRTLIDHRIGLYQALGGSWTQTLEPPLEALPTPLTGAR